MEHIMKRDFKIYSKTVKDGVGDVTVIKTIEAEDIADVVAETKKLRKEMKSDGIYWDYINEYVQLDKDGKKVASAESMELLHEILSKKETLFEKVWDEIYFSWCRLFDAYDCVKRGFQRMFTHYDTIDSFNIDGGVLRFLLHNLPKMIENLHAMPGDYAERVSDDVVKDIARKIKVCNMDALRYNIAFAMWKTKLEDMLLNARLYQYYVNFGIQEKNSPDYVDENDYPIPMLECTESNIDYKSLFKLQNDAKNRLFDGLKENFGTIWN